MNTPELHRLIQTIEALLHPETGCPWELKQTHQSLLRFLQEESYEFMYAVEQNDDKQMEDELGDVLLQVLLHAQIAAKDNRFDLESVAKNLADKMIRRHPHVFAKETMDNSDVSTEQVKDNWEKIKKSERGDKPVTITESDLAFPALYSAYKIGKKTAKLNFDWDDPSQVAYKVEEEWQELKEEMMPATINKERIKEELGDFLFSVAQLARHYDLDPEETLRQANLKFINRFQKMENLISEDGKNITDLGQTELDHYWGTVKRKG